MVSKHCVPEASPPLPLTNEEKVDLYIEYHDGPMPSEGSVYRTAAVVKSEPCAACVHDPTKPHLRTGYPDPDSPMMMRCGVCDDSWIDPELQRRLEASRKMIDDLFPSLNATNSLIERLEEKISRMERAHRVLGFVIVGIITVFASYILSRR